VRGQPACSLNYATGTDHSRDGWKFSLSKSMGLCTTSVYHSHSNAYCDRNLHMSLAVSHSRLQITRCVVRHKCSVNNSSNTQRSALDAPPRPSSASYRAVDVERLKSVFFFFCNATRLRSGSISRQRYEGLVVTLIPSPPASR
jgi:hypothetical protein